MRRQHFPGVAGWKHGKQESELQHVDDSKSGSVTTLPTSLTFVIYLLYIVLCVITVVWDHLYSTSLQPTVCMSCWQPEFRIAVTGSVVKLDKAVTIMKKLKLQGTPYKIYKNTAFIQVCAVVVALDIVQSSSQIITSVMFRCNCRMHLCHSVDLLTECFEMSVYYYYY